MAIPYTVTINVSAIVAAVTGFLGLVGAARSCSAAAEAGDAPRDADLNKLGIPVVEFRNIGLTSSH